MAGNDRACGSADGSFDAGALKGQVMKGRQVIEVNREFTLEELAQFMDERWDRERFSDFYIGHPSGASSPQYIILPATERWCTIVYPKEVGGLFKKTAKIVLTSTYTLAGTAKMMEHGNRIGRDESTYYKIQSAKDQRELNDEMRGPAEEILQEYTGHLRFLLQQAGYIG